ncbi:hypothetical protein [Mangrovihabitans endophyticus]|uniref:Uncharacterized protein n=1 Tax=Mangrovihabitans endophyticus TaxID=1751298 RepID=A0A8J3FN85_9ACTN|nr:hypothetical protein [Mangrovihabitans endophyticus]GGK79323.1 hypothetical protein GCM10012284_11650 [Mangrovihabitans endophyticus]
MPADNEMPTEAAAGATLFASERKLLADILTTRPMVVHPPSGNGQDDIALVQAGARVFLYEGHPATELWTWDLDKPRIRPDCSYFGRSFVCDDNGFPANGAIMWQWTLGEAVTAIVRAGFAIQCIEGYAEPFWRMGGVGAAAAAMVMMVPLPSTGNAPLQMVPVVLRRLLNTLPPARVNSRTSPLVLGENAGSSGEDALTGELGAYLAGVRRGRRRRSAGGIRESSRGANSE